MYPHMVEREQLSDVSPYKGTNSRGLTSWPNRLPKVPPRDIITLGIRALTYEFWGDTFSLQHLLKHGQHDLRSNRLLKKNLVIFK